MICKSSPIYGNGSTPGDEAGFVTGMTVCHHRASDKVTAGEKLIFSALYDSHELHTGVMGLMYLAVAEEGEHNGPLSGKGCLTMATMLLQDVSLPAHLCLDE